MTSNGKLDRRWFSVALPIGDSGSRFLQTVGHYFIGAGNEIAEASVIDCWILERDSAGVIQNLIEIQDKMSYLKGRHEDLYRAIDEKYKKSGEYLILWY